MAPATPPTATLQRLGQIKGAGDDRALFLKLGIAEVIGAMETNCVFRGKLKERNIKGGKSAAFPIAGKMSARYHTPGEPILGQGNEPSDLNEVIINLDGLLIPTPWCMSSMSSCLTGRFARSTQNSWALLLLTSGTAVLLV
jgi:hypothetical protein